MNEDLEKTPGLNNPETYVLTHNRFNTYLVLIFSGLKKAQFYKMLYRDSPHRKIEILMSFDYLQVFGLDEDEKNEEGNFLFEISDKKYIYVGEKLISFETNDEIVDYFSEHGNNDIKYPFAYGKENIYFMSYRKYIPIQDYEKSTMKKEYQYFHEKDGEINNDPEGGDIVYGNDFINCKTIHSKQKTSK